ncbi:hypothetical protein FRB90_003312 [Tulasnella sp. 427]|nr:hypothetical protein FRB90_003312 [Tulasnella sp. 427]
MKQKSNPGPKKREMSLATPTRSDSSNGSKQSGLKPLTLASGPRPLQLSASTLSSPSSATSSRFPPPASPSKALSRSNSTNSTPKGHSKRPVPKRLSSISYTVSSDTPGASSSSAASYVSPLRSAPLLEEPRRARPSSFHAGLSGLSLGQSSTPASTNSSTSNLLEAASGSSADQPKVPAVQTLTEKHADLLRFIAAKESKCLELRTQLEQHEAELGVLKKKWERIVSKAKAKELATSSGGSAAAVATSSTHGTHQGSSSGDVVVEALMGVGRYLGGLGLADDGSSNLAAPKSSLRERSTSSVSSVSTSPPNSALPLEESPIPPAEVFAGVKPMVGHAGGLSRNASRGHKRHIYSKGSNGSITSSQSSSTVPSARASLSSVSTSMSSLEVTMTPGRSESSHVDRFDVATQLESLGMSPEQDKTGAALPWIPIPGLNKKWEQIHKGSGLEKQAKRASLLLSDVTDMSSSILGSLSSVLLAPTPSGNGPSPRPENTSLAPASRLGKPRPISMYSSHIAAPAFNAAKTSPSSSTTRSLLDEDDDDSTNFGTLTKPILPSGRTPVARPTIATDTKPLTSRQAKKAMEPADADDDWNW